MCIQSSWIHILIARVGGLVGESDMRYRFLVANRSLDTLRSIRHPENSLMRGGRDYCLGNYLMLLRHRNSSRSITVGLKSRVNRKSFNANAALHTS